MAANPARTAHGSAAVQYGRTTWKEKSMEARRTQWMKVAARAALVACLLAYAASPVRAAGYRTANFVVSAPSAELAKEIGDSAEAWRRKLAMEWIGQELPVWSQPCPINARVQPNLGAGGATSFIFDRGQVFDWKMNIQGSRERVLDSVLPHEITHTIFATHFRRPLPRWADEGACTTVEHRSEIAKQERMLIDFLKTGRGIPFSQMFAMKEYPRDVMPLYSQGHSLSQWLIESRGRKAFLDFLADGMGDENWPRAVERHYGFTNLAAMQDAWLDWVKAGRPHLKPDSSPITRMLAGHGRPSPSVGGVIRGQSPDAITPIAATEPIASAAASTSILVSTSGSLYADAALRAESERQSSMAREPGEIGAASVYDASRTKGIGWR
jgi:hypothetical protein